MVNEYEKDTSYPQDEVDIELVPVSVEDQETFKEVIGKMTYENYFGE